MVTGTIKLFTLKRWQAKKKKNQSGLVGQTVKQNEKGVFCSKSLTKSTNKLLGRLKGFVSVADKPIAVRSH